MGLAGQVETPQGALANEEAHPHAPWKGKAKMERENRSLLVHPKWKSIFFEFKKDLLYYEIDSNI